MVGKATEYVFRTRKHPDSDPWLIKAMLSTWWERYLANGEDSRPHAFPDSRIRASWAGKCARYIAYQVAGIEESNPVTVADAWRFNVGNLVHDAIQPIVLELFPGSEAEYKVRILDIGSGHVDILLVMSDGQTVVVEIKTINGHGYRRMFGEYGEGPRYQGVVQACVSAANIEPRPTAVILVVLSLEIMSPAEAAKNNVRGEYMRFAAQWTFTQEEYEAVANDELVRWQRIIELVDRDGVELVPRIIPDPNMPHHEIIRPRDGSYQAKDEMGNPLNIRKTWHCNYCGYQDMCQERYAAELAAKEKRDAEPGE